jgi:hypothetical protein
MALFAQLPVQLGKCLFKINGWCRTATAASRAVVTDAGYTRTGDRPHIVVRAATGRSATFTNWPADEPIFPTRKPVVDHFATHSSSSAPLMGMNSRCPPRGVQAPDCARRRLVARAATHSTSSGRLPFRRPSPIASLLARILSWLFVTGEDNPGRAGRCCRH